MSRSKNNEILADEIFKPNQETGISDWKTRDELDKTNLKLCNNGNIRQNTPWTDKYKWQIKRQNDKPRGKVLALRTIGFSDDKLQTRHIGNKIRDNFDLKNSSCLHCGSSSNLCIDHKNDMYNDPRVLDTDTQEEEDFQILCNKCNTDKHQANEIEKKTRKLYSVKKLGLASLKSDNFDYPWEKCLTEYDETDKECKMYTYWYDIDEFYRKRDIFKIYTRPLNAYIKKKGILLD